MPETTGVADVKTAIQRGDARLLRQVLAEHPSRANEMIRWGKDNHLSTHPLHFVSDMVWDGTLSLGQELPLVEALIEAGADLNASNGSPLNAAASLGTEEVGLRLLEAGARPDHLGLFNDTALHWAAYLGASRLVDRLIERGAPVDAKDGKYGSTPLGWTLHGWRAAPPPPWVKAGVQPRHHEIVERLVAAGAAVDPEWLDAEDVRADARMSAALRRQTR